MAPIPTTKLIEQARIAYEGLGEHTVDEFSRTLENGYFFSPTDRSYAYSDALIGRRAYAKHEHGQADLKARLTAHAQKYLDPEQISYRFVQSGEHPYWFLYLSYQAFAKHVRDMATKQNLLAESRSGKTPQPLLVAPTVPMVEQDKALAALHLALDGFTAIRKALGMGHQYDRMLKAQDLAARNEEYIKLRIRELGGNV